jgi:hypothetical protein
LHADIDAAGIVEDHQGWLFRTAPGHNADALTARRSINMPRGLMIDPPTRGCGCDHRADPSESIP